MKVLRDHVEFKMSGAGERFNAVEHCRVLLLRRILALPRRLAAGRGLTRRRVAGAATCRASCLRVRGLAGADGIRLFPEEVSEVVSSCER